ncbi:thioredoxin family protein [Fibrivirga algicola]|uniref:Thioredoxin family protein n=1 Tax=Fibrivirga algicola TaxID=2950420 RepID=A0ABX0QRL4_9BACT|nr:thioredoxin family protein [Fibrivirga algicola]NID13393.1 thioredoxin family protein [Fibrivirga algicola]
MKSLLAFLLILGMTKAPQWQLNMEQAKTEAKTNHKLILLNFSGSDWCGPCIKLKKEVFESDVFLTYADKNLVLVRADFPRSKKNQLSQQQTTHNESLAERYNPEGQFPLTVLIDDSGKELTHWVGYPATLTAQSLVNQIDAQHVAAH